MNKKRKSAVELAMEKLDREMGENVPRLTDQQKQEIAEIRSVYQAKIAQEEISAQAAVREAYLKGDQTGAVKVQGGMRSEKQRLERLMEKEIGKIRNRDS